MHYDTETAQVDAAMDEIRALNHRLRLCAIVRLCLIAMTMVLAAALVRQHLAVARLSEAVDSYRHRCVSARVANEILSVAEATAETNRLCVEAHNRQREMFEAALPVIFYQPDEEVAYGDAVGSAGGGVGGGQ